MSTPNFSGHWKLNVEKSRLESPQPDSSIFLIEHGEPRFVLTRTHTFADRSDTVRVELTTDGVEHRQDFGAVRARMSLRWEGSDLFADMIVQTADDEGSNKVWYSLADGGKTLIVREEARSPKYRHDNLWVFDRIENS